MTPEEQAAADAAVAAAKAAADAAAGTKDAAYWEGEAKKAIAARDEAKAKVKELTPAAARLKEIEDAAKTREQLLGEENAALKAKADRADALTAAVQETFDAETEKLTDAQKAAIVGDTPDARLRHLRALRAAGMLGPQGAPPLGSTMPGAGGAGTITESAFVSSGEAQRKHYRQQVSEGKLRVIPG